MALRDLFVRKRLSPLLMIVLIWALAVYAYEFKILKRPSLSFGAEALAVAPAPEFGLANVTFDCASQRGFVTSVKITGSMGALAMPVATCESPFREATTRCPSNLPMSGYGDQIKCANVEAIHCHGGPLQTLGLFNADSFCGDVSERDLGPPQESARAEE
jgi:hypothetical protein